MTVNVLSEIEIDRPPRKVAALAGDPSRAPDWYVNIVEVEWKTQPPLPHGVCRQIPRPVFRLYL